MFLEIFMHVILRIYRRRDIYFLNICYIRVFYRFNRSRVLQVDIRAWLVFPGLELDEIPCLYATCMEVLSVLVVLFRSFRCV